ncbi:nuclear transport factor 2 family protein [Nocardia sp. NPDC019395]|uniref:nuclear transport factor 2 family protein n=1 Tax=Nocardia sp. NPDC019395 TaxID=3154686 RepID=UPI0033F17EFD
MHLPARTLWLSRAAATTVAAAALAVGLTACGSDDGSGTPETSAATSSAAAPTTAEHDHGDSGDAPTAESLQATLEQITNPDVSVDDKVNLIVDGENRRDLLDKLNAALQSYRGITYQVAEVTVDGDTATGQTTITSPTGQTAPPMPMTWQHQDGTWKLSDDAACVLLSFAQLPCTPA